MKLITKLFLILHLIVCTNVLIIPNTALAMESKLAPESKKSMGLTVTSSPHIKAPKDRSQLTIKKLRDVREDIPVRVRPCISLGDSCTQQMTNLVKEADQFVVAFMYRFNAPNLITALADKYIGSSLPVLVFLDYTQSIGSDKYHGYVKHLVNSVPTSLVKLGSGAFHHKVMIIKMKGQQAFVTVGSANATHDSDNKHSEDSLIIQSNKVAHYYLTTFHNLLKMDESEVYHEHKINNEEIKKEKEISLEIKKSQIKKLKTDSSQRNTRSNTDTLNNLVDFLSDNDVMNDNFGQEAVVTSLSTSTGSSAEQNSCLDTVQKILSNDNNKALVLFENYLSFKQTEYPKVWEHLLNNDVPKLIVLDDNGDNKNATKLLSSSDNTNITSLIFRPYTSGEFHHKLIIQYPDVGNPIIYTGSFNLSNNAVTRNSETIIGVSSKELSRDYIASILWQSDLGNQLEVLKFILKKNALFVDPNNENDKINLVIKKIIARNKMNMDKYSYRFEGMIKKISSLDKGIKTSLEMAMQVGEDSFNSRLTSFNHLAASNKLLLLENGRNLIFRRPLAKLTGGPGTITLSHSEKKIISPVDDPRFTETIKRNKEVKTYSRNRSISSGSISTSTTISRFPQTERASSSHEDKFEDSVFNSCYTFILEKIKIIRSSISYLAPFPKPEWKEAPQNTQILQWLLECKKYIDKLESKTEKIESQFKKDIEEEKELGEFLNLTKKMGKLKIETSSDFKSKKEARQALNDLKVLYTLLWDAYDYPESFKSLKVLGETLEYF